MSHQSCCFRSIIDFRIHNNAMQPIINNFSGFPYHRINIAHSFICIKEIKLSNIDNIYLNNIPKIRTILRMPRGYGRCIITYSAIMIITIHPLNFNIDLFSVSCFT